MQNFDKTPITGALNAGGVKKIAIFDQYVAFCRKWYKIGP